MAYYVPPSKKVGETGPPCPPPNCAHVKNYLRSSVSTLRLRNLATLSIEQQLTDKMNFDIATEEFANKMATKVTV